MKSTKKAQQQMQALQDILTLRLGQNGSGLNTVRADVDANSWPLLVLSVGGNEASGQPVVVIRTQSQDAISKDVFGNQLTAFNPQLSQMYSQTGVSIDKAGLAIVHYEVSRRADILQSYTTQASQTVQSQIDNGATTLDCEIYELAP